MAAVDLTWKPVLGGKSGVGFLHPRNGPMAQGGFSSRECALKRLGLLQRGWKMGVCDTCRSP